jgi:hypothetical protein
MKRKSLFLLCFLFPAGAFAADGLGRLFFTPEQRAQLETARAQRDRRAPVVIETEPAPKPVVSAPQPRGPEVVTFSGVVQRSDGKSTVWVNGKPVTERNRIMNDGELAITGVRNDGSVTVAVPQASRRAALKVGQSLDVESGVIEEPYARRLTTPRVAAPAGTTQATPPALPVLAPTEPLAKAEPPARPAQSAESRIADQALRALRRLFDTQQPPEQPSGGERVAPK